MVKNHNVQGMAKSALVIAIAVSATATYAKTEQTEIEQLRAEIQELRALIQQQNSPTIVPAQQVSSAESKTEKQPVQTGYAIQSKASTEATVYGFVRGDVSYQAEGGKSIFNRIDDVALNGEHNDKLYSTVNTTRLGVDFKTPLAAQTLGGKIEVDLRDGGTLDSKLRLRHGYLTYDNWLIGQTTSSFSNLEVIPEMLDFNLNVGVQNDRRAMLRYSDNLSAETQFFVGLEQKSADNRLPTLTAKINQKYAEGKGIVSGRAFVEQNRAKSPQESLKTTAWGLGVGTAYQINPTVKAFVDYSHSEGNKDMTMYSNAAFVLDATTLENNVFDAVSLGATYLINEKLRSTLGYGMMQAKENRFADLNQDANKTLQQGWVNMMYTPNKPMTFGVEYVYGERETFAGEKGKDNRVAAMARYSF